MGAQIGPAGRTVKADSLGVTLRSSFEMFVLRPAALPRGTFETKFAGNVSRETFADIFAGNVSRETLRAKCGSLADAEASEKGVEHVFGGGAADQPVEGEACAAQFLGHQQRV
jgi:hypothetical protein